MIRNELRAMIEGVDMRGSARRIKEDHTVGFRDVVTISRRKRIVGRRLKVAAQTSQRNRPKSA
jgi:hypothetical protein